MPGLALLCAVPLVAALTLTPGHAQSSPEGTAAEPIFRQLEAFRGYPEIAESTRARVLDTHLAPDGHAHVRLEIHGANGQHVEAVYEMVNDGGAWKINGVLARPDPGEEA